MRIKSKTFKMSEQISETESWEHAMEGVRAWERFQQKEGFKCLFKRKSFDDEFLELRWYERWFYWVKTLICLKLRRLNGSYLNDSINVHHWNEETCATQDGTYYSWWSCWVEKGVFKNWNVDVSKDGT